MTVVDWNSFSSDSKKGDKNFLKLEPNKSYKVRFVGKPCEIWKYWIERSDGQIRRAITEDPRTCVIAKKHGEKPKQRFAVQCFDRADGKLKILEAPISIFKSIAAWYNESGVEPGSKGAGDFAIKVERPGNDPKNTRYTVMFLNYVPFTKEEIETFKTSSYDLAEIFKPVPQDQIEEIIYGDSQDGDSKTSGGASKPAKQPAKAEVSDDLDF